MTIATAFSNALSGLTAASRSAEAIADNIANAGTEGFRRREVALVARATGGAGGGVLVAGSLRALDAPAQADRRLADAGLALADARGGFFGRLEALFGVPGTAGALSDRIVRLEMTLTEAAARPDETARLAAVAEAAGHLAQGMRAVSDGLSGLRTATDATIAGQVRSLNDGLARIAELNTDIVRMRAAGGDANGLLDERDRVIDALAGFVPLQVSARADGSVAVFTAGGAVLLDARPVVVGFVPTAVIGPATLPGGGVLSGLTLDGRPAATEGPGAALGGGALAAQFEIRDRLAVEAQAGLDALARDLVERLSDPALDTTLGPGDAGLFTDAGGSFDPANEIGLSARLVLNPAADPAAGGQLHRLRDGLNAPLAGPVGDGSLLAGLATALADARLPASPALAGPAGGVAQFAAGLVSRAGTARQGAEAEQSFAAARRTAFAAREAATQVSTDTELQNLLRVEQSFAANARVIEAIGQMLDELRRI